MSIILLNSKVEVIKSGKVYVASIVQEIDGETYYFDPEKKEGYKAEDLKVLEEPKKAEVSEPKKK
jgi:hypothetical protein